MIKKFIFLLFCIVNGVSVCIADSFWLGDLEFEVLSEEDKTCSVVFSTHWPNNVVIPSEVQYNDNSYKVIAIGQSAFRSRTGLVSVELPDGITQIGYGAFYGCTGLVSVNFPDALTQIDDFAFFGCISLPSVKFPGALTQIGNNAFYRCTSLTSVEFPDTLTVIGAGAFFYCEGLVSLDLPDTLTQIGSNAFESCTGLTSVKFPNALTQIGNSPFDRCNSLTTVIYDTSTPSTYSSNFFGKLTAEVTLYVPEDCLEKVKGLTPWNEFKNFQALPSRSISKEELSIWSGETSDLNVSVSPEEMPFGKVSVDWKSSDLSIATVEGDGFNVTVNAIKEGEAIIDCILTWENVWKQTLQCNVTVKETKLIESLSIEPTVFEAEEGETFQITATVLPEEATDKTLEWSSSDESVATVDETGLVSVLKDGDCVITVRTTDGSDLTANCYLSATTGINGISSEATDTVDVYTLDGMKIKTECKRNELVNIPAGVYLLRNGNKVEKLIIR